MAKRNLLLGIDAFGTIFTPKRPIATQYGEVARSLGLNGFTDEQVNSSFRTAFKQQSKLNPNFGKSNGMNAEKWWTNIIYNTFEPLVGPNEKLNTELAPRLLYRFSSEEGYALTPGAMMLLSGLRARPLPSFDRVVVGVITNSDDRIPSILTSLGLRVSSLRFGSDSLVTKLPTNEQCDIDFTVMSYDVGYEKPDKRIFDASEEMLRSIPVPGAIEPNSWSKLYVGDDYEKDIVGARDAGWSAVLVADTPPEKAELAEKPQDASELSGHAFAVRDLAELARWLGVDVKASMG
ncbi:hypothetical protein BAUCODRAFT_125979 [Baudoinia panamericana UAMH 10762]|uniref:Haloacid dehalogenase-like hydrolase n=1 Tax=Baudoinia panamericana (strain UAMH 10762) TaxID=717646 RepID=M2MNN3_BAUPA|nr:uncharacterized protein BAUCODRAFT_125979 [Baudoinia panamericana UAMH 10762]EMC93048.1 hypothetical protein BAUCODRAFT_125979 [Baudoinia panamericana UAMH 10762]